MKETWHLTMWNRFSGSILRTILVAVLRLYGAKRFNCGNLAVVGPVPFLEDVGHAIDSILRADNQMHDRLRLGAPGLLCYHEDCCIWNNYTRVCMMNSHHIKWSTEGIIGTLALLSFLWSPVAEENSKGGFATAMLLADSWLETNGFDRRPLAAFFSNT